MTGIRWTADLDAEYRPTHRLWEQSDWTGKWELVAEVIPADLPDGELGFVATDEGGNEIAATLTRAGAQRAAESYLDNRNEAAWDARQEDVDVVTLREQAWADHQDAEVLHDRREVA
ncbi:hypothetical protein [Microcystis phage Mae-JY09]